MSSNLMWKLVEPPGGSLSYELKRTISRKLWDTDGSCGGDVVTVDRNLIPYLEGLMHGGVNGAEELIELIDEHEEIQLWHEH